jgi:uncharacterized protein YndB with AHSA1/START domain
MPSFSHTVEIPRPAEEVFPWLLEEDKVPQWTGSLEAYELVGGGPIGQGSRVRQTLELSGHRFSIEMEVVRHEPPHAADTRFGMSGVEVEMTYRLAPASPGTRLTQTIDARASGFKARMLIPVVQPRLETKLTEDLGRLQALLG